MGQWRPSWILVLLGDVGGAATGSAGPGCGRFGWLRRRRAVLVAAQVLLPGSQFTLRALLEVWLAAGHPWKPSTVVGTRSVHS